MIAPDLDVTDRPWTGPCATTGLTMREMADQLIGLPAPAWVKRAAVDVFRAYGGRRFGSAGLRRLTELLDIERCGGVSNADRRATEALVDGYRKAGRLDGTPQYPTVHEPWMERVAVLVCDRHGIRGLCDPRYIANVIADVCVRPIGGTARRRLRWSEGMWQHAKRRCGG